MFEKGLEEIKKISKETKQLQDKISHFAYKINVTGQVIYILIILKLFSLIIIFNVFENLFNLFYI